MKKRTQFFLEGESPTLNSFDSELLSTIHHNNVSFTSFEYNFVNVLNKQAPQKFKSFSWQSKATFE